MNESIFMKVEGPDITGGSQEANHTGQIELDTCNIAIITPSVQHGGGLGGGKASIPPLPISMKGEKHSVDLLKAVGQGTQFNKIIIENLKTTGQATLEKFYVVTMTTAKFENLHISSSAGQMYESCEIVAEQTELEFFGQDSTGGLTSTGIVKYDSKRQEWS
ncbi:MAG: hypothetical protein DWQ47_08950 [Acidobacteria bacterium]|nr:MAG: hypothetical protein DWQ32_17050 [Acidobacteriota bacterium]REJ98968.1 MAG: hypothetical protein DWQ38_12930 [Acidobacteriota bacterium]REK16312.1 MAG: hypothetical protein DWQ43_04760 [Acidobacteriota bacterium]REK43993.1 MAG: hypothetical protein DWQ47_08950 [Acidobacteriota bacterium]